MGGIRSFSESLSKLVDSLPAKDLPRALDYAVALIGEEYADEPWVVKAVNSYWKSGFPNPVLSRHMARRAEECDLQYQALEDRGKKDSGANHFRLMCLFNGLTSLFQATDLSLRELDHILYDFSFGVRDPYEFGRFIEEALRKRQTSKNDERER